MLIGLAVVLLASWFGMYLARGITGPIKLLAEGTQAVAAGNLNYEIPPVGDDEIGQLVDSFNRMTTDLRASRAELERRRRYTETLLRNVSAGVVGLNPEGRVTAINPCAERLLGMRAPRRARTALHRMLSANAGACTRQSVLRRSAAPRGRVRRSSSRVAAPKPN